MYKYHQVFFYLFKKIFLYDYNLNKYFSMAKVINKTKITGKIVCDKRELDLGITLKGGQSFRWTAIENGKKYRGVFAGEVWTLHQDDRHIYYKTHGSKLKNSLDCENELTKYFNLHVSLKENLENWSSNDENFEKFSNIVDGVRILNQDVVENTFSFICSANNNIVRITGMVEKMCRHFGKKICQLNKEWYHDFPTIESLAQDNVQSLLSTEGFGYRAPYIHNTAKKLVELGGRKWLESLHKQHGAEYETARQAIQVLPGVGPKVADCICLMSLGHLESIPVDTHIYQVARETYLPNLKQVSSVTPAIYHDVSRHLRTTWGPLAGWAQAVVFCTRIKDNSRKKKTQNDVNDNSSKKLKKK
ncbi:N-glycosylase/DNA lyase [Microplitis demolitor]|uniref:N-glycosylase/DNA lyase n=1 Tax=Microplitis demolitor TaxID=69319 RepID=UPI00235B6C93|nr:N-glycosylase/DNA lyase [Microplitis demolitor]